MIPAILTTFLYALSAFSAGRSTRLLGSSTANFCRLVLATLVLACWAHVFGLGIGGGGFRWFFLSGVVGFGIGDLALYGAYPRIGPRLGVLLCLCLAVPLGALFEWVWLGTLLSLYQILWSTIILIGVIMAVVPERVDLGRSRQWGAGILMGAISAMGQGGGAVLTRKAYAVIGQAGLSVDGGTAAYQRILGGLLLTIGALMIHRIIYNDRSGCLDKGTIAEPSLAWKQAWPWVVINSLSGPAIGVACFQWALAIAPTGIVLAVVATTPLAVIPLTWVLDH